MNDDLEARAALWRAICAASEDIQHRLNVRLIQGADSNQIRSTSIVPDVPTWRLVEAISLLGVILRSDNAEADEIRLFGKTGPIEIEEEGTVRYIWTQQSLQGERSELNGRPDIIVTSSPELPHPENAVRIIEVKCCKQVSAPTIRSEFAKAYDFRVSSYFIWSFYSPTSKVVNGAKGLGIDLESLGFDTNRREDLIKSPDALVSRVAYSQEQSWKAQRFANVLQAASDQAQQKLLKAAQHPG